jgi:hypothetical protein
MKRLRIALVTAVAAASLGIIAAPAAAGPCHEDPCPPCHTAKIDATWQNLTGLGPLFVCPA